MKTNGFLPIGAILMLAFASMPANTDHMSTKAQQGQKVEVKFDPYRRAIKDAFHVDIKDFKDSLSGGVADGKPITAYDLEELLAGIKFEMEHTSDSFIALEIAMDHLERIPDYYSRLSRQEQEAMSDRLLEM